MFKPQDPADSGRDGKVGELGELRAQRAKERVVRLLHKDVLHIVAKILREEGIERILLGGTDRGRGLFKEQLPTPLRERIVGEFSVDRNGTDQEILERLRTAGGIGALLRY